MRPEEIPLPNIHNLKFYSPNDDGTWATDGVPEDYFEPFYVDWDQPPVFHPLLAEQMRALIAEIPNALECLKGDPEVLQASFDQYCKDNYEISYQIAKRQVMEQLQSDGRMEFFDE